MWKFSDVAEDDFSVAVVDEIVVGSIDAGIGGGGISSCSSKMLLSGNNNRCEENNPPWESNVIPKPTLLTSFSTLVHSLRASSSRCIHFFRIFGGNLSSGTSKSTASPPPASRGSGGRGSDKG